MAGQLIQMVTVVDKSGKAVNSSKHIFSVWREAKAAYKERKAEVIASRHQRYEDRKTHHTLEDLDNDRSHTSPRKHPRSHRDSRRHSYDQGHRRSASSHRGGPHSPNSVHPSSDNCFSPELHRSSPPTSPRRSPAMQRSFSAREHDVQVTHARPLPHRSYTSPPSPNIDMDLAYGELPGSLTTANNKPDKEELEGLVGKAKRLLEEADCLQYSASATIAMLQKNPEAMAAVALTLAEISNVASKMAPAVLASMKGSAPAVFALLASPQFLIAGGVAVGITIVAFGGFKIIKKIRAKHTNEDTGMDEMLEIGGDVSRIDNWRRGIAEEQANSVGTSVDGEFITPQAAALSRLNLDEMHGAFNKGSKEKKKERIKGASEKSFRASLKGSLKSSSSRRSSKEGSSTADSKAKKEKEKKPSPLRLMFQ